MSSVKRFHSLSALSTARLLAVQDFFLGDQRLKFLCALRFPLPGRPIAPGSRHVGFFRAPTALPSAQWCCLRWQALESPKVSTSSRVLSMASLSALVRFILGLAVRFDIFLVELVAARARSSRSSRSISVCADRGALMRRARSPGQLCPFSARATSALRSADRRWRFPLIDRDLLADRFHQGIVVLL